MRFGLDVSQHQMTWEEILTRTRFAEEAGFDGVWVFDHFKALYGDPTGPCLEGWSLMAALAAATDTIRIGALVTGATYRHPSVLTAQAVTVDHVSDGRLELAIGAAWFEQEHRELGIEFPTTDERIARFEDTLQVMKLLMTSDDANYDGHHFSLHNATYRPRPVQQPHPPIWIGASGRRRMLPLVGRFADAWHTFGSITDLREKSKVVDRHANEAGRDPSSILRSTSLSLSEPWDEVRQQITQLQEAGFGYLVVSFPSEGQERLDEFVEEVMPSVG